jgi:uncharacterized surface protein with fasciclin (FAS1) repeats
MKIFALVCLMFGGSLAATTVEMLAGDSRFSTLVNLVTQAQLVDTLNGGTFTIFAPTDAAFGKLPAAVVNQVTNDDALLKKVLTYHVIGGSVMKSNAKNELVVNTVSGFGARFNIYTNMGMSTYTIQGSKIIEFDKTASNGVIHVIDSVMMAPEGNIPAIVTKSSQHTTLLSLVKKAGLVTALGGQALTLFAPTDAAFDKVPNATLNAVLNDNALLTNVLKYHVVPSTQFSAGLYNNELAKTLLTGKNITVTINASGVMINKAVVSTADIGATNGVVHVIDDVLIPPADNPNPANVIG